MVTRGVGRKSKDAVGGIAFAAMLLTLWALSSPVVATHETDHRFTVEGFVCGPDEQPIADQKVIVKDTRASLVETAYTDSYGYYKAVLHLHNENLGDPILIIVGDREQRAQAQFDPKDRTTERVTRVNFGTGCVSQRDVPAWVYYGAGTVLVLAAAYAGTRIVRKRRKSRMKGRRPRR